jgi:transposase-like protein
MLPLMAAEERQEIIAILAASFAPPRQILSTLGRIKSSMRKWVQTARERIRARKEGRSTTPRMNEANANEGGGATSTEDKNPLDNEGFGVVEKQESSSSLDEEPERPIMFINARASLKSGSPLSPAIPAQPPLKGEDGLVDAAGTETITAKSDLLDQRLAFLGLFQVRMDEDGNSQFRSLALQLFGDADEHMRVRKTIVSEMWRQKELEYDFLFESSEECESYLTLMGEDGTLGDELTLRAACDCYGCVVHIVTSDPGDQYYLKYVPTLSKLEEGGALIEILDVFVALAVPVHFNAILRHCPPPPLLE